MASQKSRKLSKRQKLARKLQRDRKIVRFLRLVASRTHNRNNMLRRPRQPLSVYLGFPDKPQSSITFPMRTMPDGMLMPKWEELTIWLKCQLLVMTLHEWGLQTFTIHLHSKLQKAWLDGSKDPYIEIRERMRREFGAALGPKREYFFIVEGWSKVSKSETKLHIHGGAFIRQPGEEVQIKRAAARACGQGVRGNVPEPRSVHTKVYSKEGSRYVNYLFKSVRRKDRRLTEKRFHMSREAVGAAREFWNLITDRPASG